MAIKVRATRPGYHGHAVRKEGEVFLLQDRKGHKQLPSGKLEKTVISAEQQFSQSWMEKLGDESEVQEGGDEDEASPRGRSKRGKHQDQGKVSDSEVI